MRAFWKQQRIKRPETDGSVKISFEYPPIYNDICAAFKIQPKNVYFTYGDTIYNPDKLEIPPEIIEHEKVHMDQQNHNDVDAALWWGKYLREPEFRVDQEARAYGRQYEVMCGVMKDRNYRLRFLMQLAMSLSGPLYDFAISSREAMELIKKYANVKSG